MLYNKVIYFYTEKILLLFLYKIEYYLKKYKKLNFYFDIKEILLY